MSAPASTETHEVFNQSPVFENVNLFAADTALREAVEREGAGWACEALENVGASAGSAQTLEWGRLANEYPPKLRAFDQKGRRLDMVEYHPAYHDLMRQSLAYGLHSASWEHLLDQHERRAGAVVARCAAFFLMAQAEAGHCCPVTMTHACVPALLHNGAVSRKWLPKILSRHYDPAFAPVEEKRNATVGMGMTEKQGGTDVRANTTRAVPGGPDGAYRITGHKWFMSAPMCDAFLILAQAPAGLSCFFLPRFLPDGTVNGLRLQRLKDKLGNRSNASSEVEFSGALAWLVGEEGRGIPAIIEMVTYTRLDCALASAALMRLGLANALHHVSYRTVFQKKLIDQPLMARVLADMAVDVEAATALALRLAGSFDRAEDEAEAAYRRLMTPVAKYWICKRAPAFLYEAMECLGGNGYVEEGLLARAYREAPVNAIWEGSGNVMCLDVLRVIQRTPEAVERMLDGFQEAAQAEPALANALDQVKRLLSKGPDEADGRQLTEQLALIGAGVLLRQHAPDPVADQFVQSRFSSAFHCTYGAGIGPGEARIILGRAWPPIG